MKSTSAVEKQWWRYEMTFFFAQNNHVVVLGAEQLDWSELKQIINMSREK